MTTKPRAPMKFTLDANSTPDLAEPAPAAMPNASEPLAMSKGKSSNVDRQQVGARVTKATYRQLKAMAALRGEAVQTLVEQAINDFLSKQTSELITK
jgi:hypothetical protein